MRSRFVPAPARRVILAGGLVALLAVAGWAVLHTATAQSPATPPAAGLAPAVPVTAAAAERRDVPVILRNIGAVQAFQSVLVRARVDGTLNQVFFQEGQEVQPGDKLAQIDPRPYQAVLDQSMAKKAQEQVNLVNAQRDLARYQALAQRDFASRQQVDTQLALVGQLQASLRGDDASIAAAQLNLDFTNITSPIAGRAGLRLVDPGNLIHATDTTGLVGIAQIHPIAVIFTMPQDNLPAIQAATAKGTLPVYAYASAGGAMLATGELLTMDNSIDPATGTIKLKAKFPNSDNRLWPGQFVTVGLRIGTLTNVVAIASVAVQHGARGLYVFVVNPDQTVAVRPVEVAQDDGKLAVISKGLEDNVPVVTNGQSRLQNGTRVVATLTKANS
jgi:multidrug efflux system membrane fusion protein